MPSVTPTPRDRPPRERAHHPNALQVIDGWVRDRAARPTLVIVLCGWLAALAALVLIVAFAGPWLGVLAGAGGGLLWHRAHESGGGGPGEDRDRGSAA
jgi:hypothetical protein